jgi:hypothetical protein
MCVLKRVVSENKFLEIMNITFDGARDQLLNYVLRVYLLIGIVYLRMLEKIRALSEFSLCGYTLCTLSLFTYS